MATLRLRTGLRATCVSYQIAPLRPNGLHHISFEYRRVVGETPRVCLWQDGPERCASPKPLSGSSSWQRFDELIPGAAGTHGLRLVFFADPSDKRITIAEYRDIVVSRYRWGGSRSIRQSDTASLGRLAVSAGTLSVTETSPTVLPTHMALHAPGAVGDCNRFDSRTPAQLGLSASSVERDGIPTIRLTARDHSACVSYPMGPFESERPYELRLDYRGVSGSRPRVCVWEDGPDRCAALPELDGSAGWHRFEGTIWPTPETERIELFLYADGLGDRETVTEYRNVTVVPKRSLGLIGMPTARRVPEITYERTSPSEFRVRVTEATEPFLLVVTEAFAPGWRVEEVEDRQLSEPVHVVVNGYANGWLIPWRGTYTVRVVYGPEEYASAARRISLIAFLVACAAVLGLIAVRARQVFLRRRNESARLAKA
jgi:arabinofuranan 3-O-arabinosyltransferase